MALGTQCSLPEHAAVLPPRERREKERLQLADLVGRNLTYLSQLEGLDFKLYQVGPGGLWTAAWVVPPDSHPEGAEWQGRLAASTTASRLCWQTAGGLHEGLGWARGQRCKGVRHG